MMKRHLGFLALLVTLATGCSIAKDEAEGRVNAVLGGIKDEGFGMGPKTETAICEWYAGVIRLDQGSLGVASNQFTQWARAKGLDHQITGYKIVSLKRLKDPGEVFEATVEVEGKTLKMIVPKGEAIRWSPEG